jgi:hypothetical protein
MGHRKVLVDGCQCGDRQVPALAMLTLPRIKQWWQQHDQTRGHGLFRHMLLMCVTSGNKGAAGAKSDRQQVPYCASLFGDPSGKKANI